MESKEMIMYKWEHGVYNLQDLINLVKNNQITQQDFFKITRFNYAAAVSGTKTQPKNTKD